MNTQNKGDLNMTTIPDVIRPIRLCQGLGTEGKSACWVAALSLFLGKGHKDRLECASPVLNHLAISINDAFGVGAEAQAERTRVIIDGGHLFSLVGTLDTANESKRMYILIDAAIRLWPPVWMRKTNDPQFVWLADEIERLEPVVDERTRIASRDVTRRARDAYAHAYASAYTASAYAYASAYADHAYASAYAAANSASAYAYASSARDCLRDRVSFIEQHVIPVYTRMVEAGIHAPREEVPVIKVKPERFLSAFGIGI